MPDRIPSKLARYVRRFLRNMDGEDIQGAGNIESESHSTEQADVGRLDSNFGSFEGLAAFELADEESKTIIPFAANGPSLILIRSEFAGNEAVLAHEGGDVLGIIGGNDFAFSDTDGESCVFWYSGGNEVVVKNRTGAAEQYRVTIIGHN